MAPRKRFVGIVCASLLSSTGGSARPQETPATKDQAQTKRTAWLHEAYLREASAYQYFLDPEKRQPLVLRREPVMRWTSSGDYNGEVYVWTHQGTAAIVGCIFSGPGGNGRRRVMHEFHSLAPGALYSGARGGSGWLPAQRGISLEPIADAPEPAQTPARRLTQMRDLARRFTAQVQRENSKWEMRLLSQPIYRYEISDETGSIVDGAVFAFVWTAGTDPEVLIVIEAKRTEQGIRWYYAPARFTNCEAWVQHQGKQVWRADPSPAGIFDGVTTTPYGAFQVKAIPDQGER
jgi:hypothetical protein